MGSTWPKAHVAPSVRSKKSKIQPIDSLVSTTNPPRAHLLQHRPPSNHHTHPAAHPSIGAGASSLCLVLLTPCLQRNLVPKYYELTSISGWSVGTFIEVACLQDAERVGVVSGVPMKKASAPSTRQAKARTLANIIVMAKLSGENGGREMWLQGQDERVRDAHAPQKRTCWSGRR